MSRAAAIAIAVIAVGAAVGAWFQGALAWDGSYFLFNILENQGPFLLKARYAGVIFQLPVLAAMHLTGDMSVLRLAFSVGYGTPAPVAILLSWLVARRQRSDLLFWPVLGVALVTLPSAMYGVSEAVIVAQFAWPLILCILVGLRGRALPVAIVLTVVVFFLHPLALVVLLVASATSFLVARQPGARHVYLDAWGALFALAAIGRYLLLLNSNDPVHGFLLDLVANDPSRMQLLVFLIAGLLGAIAFARRRWPRTEHVGCDEFPLLAGVVIGVAAGALFVWANTPPSWEHEIDYREYAVLLEVPLFGGMVADALWPRRAVTTGATERGLRERARVVVALAAVFTTVLSLQEARWHDLSDRLKAQLVSAPASCVDPSAVGVRHTLTDGNEPVGDWFVPPLAIVLQSRQPRHVLLNRENCDELVHHGRIRVTYFDTRPTTPGWFNFPR